MKNTNSIFYSSIGHLSRLRYKFLQNKCATLIDKSSLEIIRNYRLNDVLATVEIEYKDRAECVE